MRTSTVALSLSLALTFGCMSGDDADERPANDEHIEAATSALTGVTKFAFLKCRFNDDLSDQIDNQALTALVGRVDQFWTQTSYGKINLAGSTVQPPCAGAGCTNQFVLSQNKAFYLDAQGGIRLDAFVNECAGLADAAGLDFSSSNLYGLAIVPSSTPGGNFMLDFALNPTRDGRSIIPLTWNASAWSDHTVAHEIGHTYGLPHMRPDPGPGVNGISYDVLATDLANTAMFHKDALAWVDPGRRFVPAAGSTSTITLERSALPGPSGYLMARAPIRGTTGALVLEARRFAGTFEVFPRLPLEGVVISYGDTAESNWVNIVDPDNDTDVNEASSFFTPGESYSNAAIGVTASVTGQTASGYTVSLSYNPPACLGTGLQGSYYDNIDLTNLKLTRNDSRVTFSWNTGTGSPDPSIDGDTFSARWVGKVQAPVTGSYTFYTESDDGVRLWVNNVLLIDQWIDQVAEHSGTINLTAGQQYDIKLEYFENAGGARVSLSWRAPGAFRTIIPSCALFPPAQSNVLFGPDNFEDGNANGWTPSAPSQWLVVTDGSTKAYKRNSTATSWSDSRAGSTSWTNQVVEARVKVTQFAGSSSSNMAALYARYTGTSPGSASAYYAALRGDGAISIRKRTNGSNTTLGGGVAAGITAGTWYTLRLEAMNAGSQVVLKLYLNGVLRKTFTDSSPLGAGQVAVGSFGAAAAFDDVKVTSSP